MSGYLGAVYTQYRDALLYTAPDGSVKEVGSDLSLPGSWTCGQMTLEQNGTLYVYARSDNAPVVVEAVDDGRDLLLSAHC